MSQAVDHSRPEGSDDDTSHSPDADAAKDKPLGDGGKDDAGKDDAGKDDDSGGDEPPAKPPLYKRPLFWIILLVVAAIAIVGGTLWWLHARQFESTDDAFVDAHIVRLAPQVSGRLQWVADKDNQHVRPGELLAVIEPSGPAATLQGAQAEVAQADAGIEQARGRVIAAEAQRSQAAANARAPEADARRAARDLARYEALLRLDPAAVAATTLDQARAQAESTAAQAAAARRQIATAGANVLVERRGIAAAAAQRRAAQARVAEADVTVGDLRIRAPIAGQVVNRTVNVGSYVSPQTQMMALVPDQLWITANFKETQLALMRRGQHVAIHVDAFPDIAFEGLVDSVQRGAGQAFALLPPQNATGNYVKVVQRVPVRIVFDLRDGRPDPRRYALGPGMSVVPTVKVR